MSTPPYVVVDVETTGLRPDFGDKLLEIAVMVIDPVTLEPLPGAGDGFHAIVRYPSWQAEEFYLRVPEVVRVMHSKSGLWDKLSGPQSMSLNRIDSQLTEYLSQFGEPKTMPAMGNSVRLDMNFIDTYLPRTSGYLDYHMRDVSTLAGLAHDWYGLPYFQKARTHQAMNDVLECIAELKYLREGVFK